MIRNAIVAVFVLVVFSFAGGCAHSLTSTVGVGEECRQSGSFVPGERVASCDLFDYQGERLGAVEIADDEQGLRYCAPEAWFVRCHEASGGAILPMSATAPICPFLGDKPDCPEMQSDVVYQQVKVPVL